MIVLEIMGDDSKPMYVSVFDVPCDDTIERLTRLSDLLDNVDVDLIVKEQDNDIVIQTQNPVEMFDDDRIVAAAQIALYVYAGAAVNNADWFNGSYTIKPIAHDDDYVCFAVVNGKSKNVAASCVVLDRKTAEYKCSYDAGMKNFYPDDINRPELLARVKDFYEDELVQLLKDCFKDG